MSSRHHLLLAVLLVSLSLSACIVYAPTEPSPQVVSQQQPTAPQPETPPTPTIAGAVQACKAIQQDAEIPVSCILRYVDNTPVMYVGFPDANMFSQLWSPFTEAVGVPFCMAANNVSRQAYVSVIVRDALRIYACETSEWSDWLPLDDSSDERAF